MTMLAPATFVLLSLGFTDPILERFNGGLNGWVAETGANIEHAPVGGNPGGMMRVIDAGVPDMTVVAPAPFLGDLSAFRGGGLWFDATMLYAESPDLCLPTFGVVTIEGPAGVAAADLAPACVSLDCWTRFSARMSPATWGVSEATWDAILADVTRISFRVEGFVHDDEIGIDNVVLTPPNEPNHDLTGDGLINVADLLLLLSAWGPCGECCPYDLIENGSVDIADLLALLAGWS